jgi:hypothetical protein
MNGIMEMLRIKILGCGYNWAVVCGEDWRSFKDENKFCYKRGDDYSCIFLTDISARRPVW